MKNAERVKATLESARIADYTNPQKLRVMLNTTLAETMFAKRIILITFRQDAK